MSPAKRGIDQKQEFNQQDESESIALDEVESPPPYRYNFSMSKKTTTGLNSLVNRPSIVIVGEEGDEENKLEEGRFETTFSRDRMRQLFKNTITKLEEEYSRTYSLDEMMELVEVGRLDELWGPHLCSNGINHITLEGHPSLDMGKKPESYEPSKGESEQAYLVPKSVYPDKVVVRYSDCKPTFKSHDLQAKYKKSKLEAKGITFNEFEKTIVKATEIMKPYRGVVNKYDLINIGNVCGGLFLTIIICFIVGSLVKWYFSIIFILLYLLFASISICLVRRKSNKYLRQAFFLLALYCRVENNRLYRDKWVLLRPGYLAKWVEFRMGAQPKTNNSNREEQ